MKPYSIIVLMLISLLSVSCSDFWDKEPQGVFTLDSYYQTPDEILTGVTYCYQALWLQEFQSGRFMVGNIMTDDAAKGGPVNEGVDIINSVAFNILPNTSLADRFWGNCYTGLTRCNLMLDIISKRDFSEENPSGYDLKNRMEGELKFLRAFFSYYLVTVFGEVPYFTRPTVSNLTPDLYESKDRSVIWQQIMDDLTDAVEYLPKKDEYQASDQGRITKGAAQFLLARAYLFNERYDDAAVVLRALIKEDNYTLCPDYKDIFAKENEFSTESIFEIPFGEQEFWRTPGSGGHGQVMTQFQSSRSDSGWGYNVPTQDLVDAFEEGDPRLIYSVIFPDDEFQEGVKQKDDTSKYGYFNRKIFLPVGQREPVGNVDFHLRMFRLADAYLMYAEASTLGTSEKNTDEAIHYLNEVRKRANNSTKKDPLRVVQSKTIENVSIPERVYTTDEQLMADIKHERRVELAMEDIRYWDLLRWGDIEETMKAYYENWKGQPTSDGIPDDKGKEVSEWVNRFPDDVYPVFPVPQDAIINSDNQITQSKYY